MKSKPNEGPGAAELAPIPWWKTDLGRPEWEALERAVRGRHIHGGALCRGLEERLATFLGVPHVTLTTSGSAALLLALEACGVGAGDEVVVPALGFVAPAHAALLLGAKVRLADVGRDRPLVDPGAVEAAIGGRTRAVVALHLNGAACDLAALGEIARRRGVALVEDAAQAFGSRSPDGRPLGTAGSAGAFSMGITKMITAGEGGFVVTGEEAAAGRVRRFRNHGVERIADNVFERPGFNLRFTDLLAAVADAQLDQLEEKCASARRVSAFYRRRLAGVEGIELTETREAEGEVPLWAEALSDRRDELVAGLATRGVQARPFHPSLAESPHLCPGEGEGAAGGETPNAARFARRGLVLPSGPGQSEETLERAAAAVEAVLAG